MPSRRDSIISADAWDGLVKDLIALGPHPAESEVIDVLVTQLWAVEGIALSDDHRGDDDA